MRLAIVVFALGATSLLAQEQYTPAPIDGATDTGSSSFSDQQVQSYQPLTLTQSYLYSFNQMFGPAAVLALGIHTAFDQMRVHPIEWGQSEHGLEHRLAYHFEMSLLRQNVAFAVRAFDHEDPRYFASGQKNVLKRTRYALAHAVIARKTDGSEMPAYSRFVVGFTTPEIAEAWRPSSYNTVGNVMASGSISIATAAITNVFREFLPDVKKFTDRRWPRASAFAFRNVP
jgi:hypothetical protein